MLWILIKLIPLYFLPTIVSWYFQKDRMGDRFMLNFGFGWVPNVWLMLLTIAVPNRHD